MIVLCERCGRAFARPGTLAADIPAQACDRTACALQQRRYEETLAGAAPARAPPRGVKTVWDPRLT